MIKYFDNKGQLIQDGETIIRMEKVSTRLFSTFSLNIMQEVFSTIENRLAFRKPLVDFNSSKILAKFKTNDKFFLINPEENLLEKLKTISYDLSQEPYIILPNDYFSTASQDKEPIQFWIGFESDIEGEFTDYLQIYLEDDLTGEQLIIKEFLFSCYAESDDIRYKILLSNLGQSIDSDDYLAFFESDINEKLPDNILLNRKRKELIYTLPDILPFIGSYKALVNAIKYFGYKNVKLKEYWKNVNTDSPGFGRIKQVEIAQDIFNLESLNDSSRSNPSIIWRKSNTFGLFFDIIVQTDEEDEQDLPVTEEVFSIPISEIFAKITYLKAKLEKDFIMLNSRIIDIVAEAIYFGKVAFKVSSNLNRIESLTVNINPSFEIEGGCEQEIINLRQLEEFGCPIGSDLQLTGESDLLHHRLDVVQLGSSFLQSRYTLEIDTTVDIGSVTVDLFQRDLYQRDNYTLEQIAELLVQEFSASANKVFRQHRFFIEPSSPTTIRIVQREPVGISLINDEYWDINLGFTFWADTAFPFGLNIDVSPGSSYFGVLGAPLSYYSDAILASFDSFQPTLLPLVDSPLTPIGAPIILRNTSFNLALEDLDITFEELGAVEGGSFEILGFDAVDIIPPFPVSNYLGSGQTIVQPLPNFDYSDYPSESSPNLLDLGYGDFYEGEWEITNEDNGWIFNSGRLTLENLDNYPIILPFIGQYTVKLTLYDMMGGESVLIDQNCLTVTTKESQFISWRRAGLKDYQFTDYKKKYADSLESVFGLPADITIGEVFSPLEHPIPENESIDYTEISLYNFDQVEFYQDLIYKIPNDLPNIGPRHYKIENLESVTLEDLYHVWVDMCSPSVVVNRFNAIGDSGIIYMGNYNEWENLLKTNPDIIPVETDVLALAYTGPADSYIVSKESGRVYFFDFALNKVDRTQYTIGVIELGDQTGLPQLDRMLNFVDAGNQTDSKWFKDNIFYLEWDYSGIIAEPYVKIVSKQFEFEGKYYLSSSDLTWNYFSNYSYIDGGFPLGDIRPTFEIFSVDSSLSVIRSIKIGDAPAYLPVNTDLDLLADELNAAIDVEGINLFSYNTVFDALNNALKIIAVLKTDSDLDNITIIYENIIGTRLARSLSDNPKMYDVRIDRFYDKPYPNGTLMFFVIDNSEINGKSSAIWKISKLNENGELIERLELKSINLSFLFNEKGWWNIECQIEDNNGNLYPSKNKKILIK